jgi:SNF2 family DNA or RNA helicase
MSHLSIEFLLSATPFHTPHQLTLHNCLVYCDNKKPPSVSEFRQFILDLDTDSVLHWLYFYKFLKSELLSKRHTTTYTNRFFYNLNEKQWAEFYTYLANAPFENTETLQFKDSLRFARNVLKPLFYFSQKHSVDISPASLAQIDVFDYSRFNKIAVLKNGQQITLIPSYERNLLNRQIKSVSLLPLADVKLDEFFKDLTLEQILNSVDIADQIDAVQHQFVHLNTAESLFIYRQRIMRVERPKHSSATLENLTAELGKLPKQFDELLLHPSVLFDFVQSELPQLQYDVDEDKNDIIIQATIQFKDFRFEADRFKDVIKTKNRFVQLANNNFLPLTNDFKRSIQFYLNERDYFGSTGAGIRLRKNQFAYVEHLTQNVSNVHFSMRYKKFAQEINKTLKTNVLASANFLGALRGYQKIGLQWLSSLNQLGFGGILADDMGLGKTVQVLAFLSTIPNQNVLILCPPMLHSNWTREITRFLPSCQATLATYSDVQAHLNSDWDIVILDEAQAIKNSKTALAQALFRLKTRTAFALTGTPLENNYDDLWAIFEFILPQFLGTKTQFTKRYKKQIERYHNDGNPDAALEVQKALKERISPFILRRLKLDKSVVADLPAKVESTIYCRLTTEQASLYQKLIVEYESYVPSLKKEKVLFNNKPIILTLFLRLKQVCNHPVLLGGSDLSLAKRSGKFEQLRGLCSTLFKKPRESDYF